MIISPQGRVITRLESDEGIIYADIDIAEVDSMRAQIPTFAHKRTDL
jgi:omega-amidase